MINPADSRPLVADHLYGYLTAPWDSCSTAEGAEHQKQGIDQLAAAINALR